jgi:hypothetical protein
MMITTAPVLVRKARRERSCPMMETSTPDESATVEGPVRFIARHDLSVAAA